MHCLPAAGAAAAAGVAAAAGAAAVAGAAAAAAAYHHYGADCADFASGFASGSVASGSSSTDHPAAGAAAVAGAAVVAGAAAVAGVAVAAVAYHPYGVS